MVTVNKELKILMLEDVPEDAELIKHTIQKEKIPFISYLTDNKQGFIKGLKEFEPDLILSDYSLPSFNGLEALELVKKISPEIPFIMVTGSINEETAVECMKRGAWDYVIKENLTRLGYAVINVLKLKEENDKIKMAEIELKESEDKFRNFVETSADLVFRLSITGYMHYVSPRVEDLYGYKLDELIGKHMKTTTPVREIPRAIKALNIIFAGKPLNNFEISQKTKAGRIIPMEINAVPVYKSGKIVGLQGVMRDITERKRAEQIQKVLYNISTAAITSDNLKKLIGLIQKELASIIDTTNFYVALYNNKTDTLSLPFHVDEKDEYTNVPAGKTLTKYVIETNKPLLANIDVKKRFVREGKIEYKGSLSKIWLGVPLKIEEKVIGVLAVQSYTDENAYTESDMEMLEFVSDQISISIDRKRAEQELKDALVKATESDRLKSAFLATMSHELRTPLNAVIGFSDLISEDLTIEEIVSFTKIINSSGIYLLSIIEDLLDITLIESGETNIYKKEVKLHTILTDIFDVVKIEQQVTNKEHIDLKLLIPSAEKDLTINTDPSKLKQILINLLKNAIKFTDKGYVHYGYSIETEQHNSIIKFYIEDSGIGIHKDLQELIFDMFRQGDDTHTRKFGGTGIGLSISRKLVELLGGRLWFESEVGKGSTFYFTIPFDGKKEILSHAIETVTKKRNDLKDKTVLIVEDDELSYEFLETLLEKSGINVIWAKNGEESIEHCKENARIDLVLMDIKMPKMNGYVATEEIKKFRPDLSIIAQTAYAIAGDREKALEAGCDDYISKPINKELLLEMINHHMKRK